jgi:iron complex transport system ATP-binding protein
VAYAGEITGLQCGNLCAGYSGRPRVLAHLTLRIAPGKATVLVGPNGSGKTTLLRTLLGTLPPTAGSCLLDGVATLALTDDRRAQRLAYVPQHPSVAFDFTLDEYVGLGCGMQENDARRRAEIVDAALLRTDLADRRQTVLAELSSGMRQRAGLARALAQAATWERASPASRFLLLDEPTSAQDPAHALRTLDMLRAVVASGVGVIAVMHDLALARRWADEAVVLADEGSLAGVGPAADMLTPQTLESVFGTPFVLARGGGVEVLAPLGPRA